MKWLSNIFTAITKNITAWASVCRNIPYLKPVLDRIALSYEQFVESQQFRMSSHFDALPLLSLLGVICGLLSGGIIVLFRLFIEGSLGTFISGDITGDSLGSFTTLSVGQRFALCVSGSLLVGLLLHFINSKSRDMGVIHVIERLDYHQGNLPLKNAVIQFFSSAISLICGQSVGREGPSIHMGAASGSILGRRLHVPNNSVRTLVGCGIAAAIAAGFNTPLAGVIFAMEVVLMEYTIIGFTPIILAAVSATTLTRLVFGDSPAFNIPTSEWTSVLELPYVAVMGILIGCVSAFFIHFTQYMSSVFTQRPIWFRTSLAGIIVGTIAMIFPEVMGIGYDTVSHALLAQISITGMIILLIAKCLATGSAIGLGIPGGLIGPSLFIGACTGSAIGLIAHTFFPEVTNPGFYAMIGMGAMMGATLQAPLAALVSLLELTANQNIILPGMIAVTFAIITSRVVFKKPSIYRLLMLAKGLDYRNSPISQTLRRIGVASVMERNILQHEAEVTHKQANAILKKEPRWIMLLNEETGKASLLPAADIARYLSESEQRDAQCEIDGKIDLYKIPAKRRDALQITIIATLQEAYEKMESEGINCLYVTGDHGKAAKQIYGVITREHVERSYQI